MRGTALHESTQLSTQGTRRSCGTSLLWNADEAKRGGRGENERRAPYPINDTYSPSSFFSFVLLPRLHSYPLLYYLRIAANSQFFYSRLSRCTSGESNHFNKGITYPYHWTSFFLFFSIFVTASMETLRSRAGGAGPYCWLPASAEALLALGRSGQSSA
jgi:hypothetical protein